MLGRILLRLIRFYQVGVSPFTPPSCRYQPTCSAYASEAIERYGAWKGSGLAVRRLLRCHPWGGSGYDPVPLPEGGQPGKHALEAGTPVPGEPEDEDGHR